MKYIASCSFGKDSLATIILAHLNNEPIDLIIYSEVMFNANISGENPLHIDFINNKAIPKLDEWGYKTKILKSDLTYLDCFLKKCGERTKHPERIGKYIGFPIAFKCIINDRCKIKPIRSFYKSLDEEVISYVGIAADEPKRLEKLKGSSKISLLAKYGYTEQMAYDLCKKYDLLSPIYEFTHRNGCWFCPNTNDREFKKLIVNHPELWEKLRNLATTENLITDKFNRTETFDELDRRLNEKIEIDKMQLKLKII